MKFPRFALLISFATLGACGGGTMRVADDPSSSDGPVSLAPTPAAEPEPAAPADSMMTPDSTPTPAPAVDSLAATTAPQERGYAAYGSNTDLEIRRIGKWSHTGVGESRRVVIRDANSWAEFWSELGTGDRPEVDFTQAVVVAVAAGQRPGGGYEIAVSRVSQAGGELNVEVLETSPGPNCLTSSALTQPVDVVVVPVAALRSWSFTERKEVRSCR
jgi:protease stability complex PrcB-like protein